MVRRKSTIAMSEQVMSHLGVAQTTIEASAITLQSMRHR